MAKEDAPRRAANHLIMLSLRAISFFLSLVLVGFGQPASVGVLGALAAVCGYALFFSALPAFKRFYFGAGWFFFVQCIQLSWMTSIEFQGIYILFVYLALCLLLAAQFGMLTLFVPAQGVVPFIKMALTASVWTLMEWARLYFLCGFSWNPVGVALTHFVPSLQFASVFGIYGLSFWVILTNLAGLNFFRSKGSARCGALFVLLAALPYCVGYLQLSREVRQQQGVEIRVALMQTDLLPSQKMPYEDRKQDYIPPIEQWKSILSHLQSRLNQYSHPPVDLIVLPEGAVPYHSDFSFYFLKEVQEVFLCTFGETARQCFPPLSPPYAEERYLRGRWVWCASNLFWCQTLANIYHSEILIGLDHLDKSTGKNFNSAFYFKPFVDQLFRYDKQILLPLAEYLPFEILRPLTKYYGINDFFTQGRGVKIFGEKVKISPSICYEETFPEILREAKKNGAEMLVNLTNDNYYPKSTLHKQHFFHARVRAVENGLPLIRACNAGVSGVIDCYGRIAAMAEEKKESVLVHVLKIVNYNTLYSYWGDWGIVFVSILVCLISFLPKRLLN